MNSKRPRTWSAAWQSCHQKPEVKPSSSCAPMNRGDNFHYLYIISCLGPWIIKDISHHLRYAMIFVFWRVLWMPSEPHESAVQRYYQSSVWSMFLAFIAPCSIFVKTVHSTTAPWSRFSSAPDCRRRRRLGNGLRNNGCHSLKPNCCRGVPFLHRAPSLARKPTRGWIVFGRSKSIAINSEYEA